MAIPKILDHERKLKNIQDGDGSLAVQTAENTASGDSAFAEGYSTTASGEDSHAEGKGTEASGYASHAEGFETTASGYESHAEGYRTEAAGHASHAEGSSTTASENFSHAEGYFTTASGYASHAEGGNIYDLFHTNLNLTGDVNSTTYTISSMNEGITIGSVVRRNGKSAIIIDYNPDDLTITVDKTLNADESLNQATVKIICIPTVAVGDSSHAEGDSTVAYGNSQHTQGKFNIIDFANTYAHIVGNGTSDTRSNAHTLDWDGNAWFAGDAYVGSTSGTNRDEGSKKLATQEYVDNNNRIFWATDETTYDELLTAYNQNKLLCYQQGNALYICSDFSLNSSSKGIFYFRNVYADLDIIGFEYYKTYIEDIGWGNSSGHYDTTSVYSILRRNSAAYETPLSASDAYYRPIYTATREPTASDGKIGDIWIVYTE